MKVYLAGSIEGLTAAEAGGWRRDVTDRLQAHGIETLDPMRGKIVADDQVLTVATVGIPPDLVVERDLGDVAVSDFVLAVLEKPSIGTAMEIWHAYMVVGVPVIFVSTNPSLRAHPWLVVACARIFENLDAAIDHIVKRWQDDNEEALPEVY